MQLPLYQVDAFASRVFSGNPAAVCPLDAWLPDELMQRIAMENNLSETAFFVRAGESYELRWFTPAAEVDLCGHATLASAFVILEVLDPRGRSGAAPVRFTSRSGPLAVEVDGERLALDFPSRPGVRRDVPDGLAAALGATPEEVYEAPYTMAVLASERELRALDPDPRALAAVDRAVLVTAPGDECDFVSRFFAPGYGIAEDPVTGSAHCTSTPYWAERLGKEHLVARQVSARGGELWCEHRGERTRIAGHAVLYLEGRIRV